MTRAVLYGRVSTDDQAQMYGLSSQVTELKALAQRKGYEVVSEQTDEGISGATLDRPALTRLRDGVRGGIFQVVLAHAPDRLSRNLAHQLLLFEEFRKAGVAVEFLTTPTEDTPEGRLLLNVSGVVAEFEREKIKERTLRGKEEKARRGLVVMPGHYPFGYRPDLTQPGRLVAHEPEADTVRLVYRLLDEGKTIRAIVDELRRLGVPAARGQWAESSVQRILSSEVYAGRFVQHYRGRDYVANIPVIIAEEPWQAAQARLRRNKALLVGPRTPRVYLLRGLLRCGVCGQRYDGVPRDAGRGYRCHSRDRLDRKTEQKCSGPNLNAGAEDAVWATIVEALRSPERLREAALRHEASRGARDVEIQSRAEHLRKQVHQIAMKEKRLLELVVEDKAQVEMVQAKLAELAKERTRLDKDLDAVKDKIAEHNSMSKTGVLERICGEILQGVDKLDDIGRQNLLHDLVDEITVRPDKTLEVHGVLGGPDGDSAEGASLTQPSGGLGGARSPPCVQLRDRLALSRGATAAPGRPERLGGLGGARSPPCIQ